MARRSKITPAAEQRAIGCLYGQVAGDNLGSLCEFQTGSEVQRRHPNGGPSKLKDGGTWNLLAGQPTDDSELALLLARSIALAGRPDPRLAAISYAWWYNGGFSRSGHSSISKKRQPYWERVEDADDGDRRAYAPVGGSYSDPVTGESLIGLRQAIPYDSYGAGPATYNRHVLSRPFDMGGQTALALAGSDHRGTHGKPRTASEANGSLMRCSPIGIWGAGRESKIVAAAARRDSAITHPSQVCQDACAALCIAIARAITTRLSPMDTLAYAVDWAYKYADPKVLSALRVSNVEPPDTYQSHKGHVLIALQNAFWQLTRGKSVQDAVVDTVRAGGDTDTNAAICGALLGAVHGFDAIPPQWVGAVDNCRPDPSNPRAHHPRPKVLWPQHLPRLARRVLYAAN